MERNFVITLDPETKSIFVYDLKSNLSYRCEESTKDLKSLIESELKVLNKLRDFSVTHWSFESIEAENYRRRAIWQYLLHPECSEFPSFITSREVSSSFAEVSDIKFSVDISEYLNTGRSSSDMMKEELQLEQRPSIAYGPTTTMQLKASLVSTIGQSLKRLKQQILKDFQVALTPNTPDSQFVLKLKGRKEYFNNNLHFLTFRAVRESLRGMKELNLKLVEMPKRIDNQFPSFRAEGESLGKISSFLMFYPPKAVDYEKFAPKLNKPRIFLLRGNKVAKERVEMVKALFNGIIENKVYTGECDWPFRVQLCGVEALIKLFFDAFKGSATTNGHDHPTYVELPAKDKPTEKKNIISKKSTKSSEKSTKRRQSISIFKFKPKSAPKSSASLSLTSAYLNHSPSSTSTTDLMNEFKLPFPPYLLSFDVFLIYGEEIIANCSKRSEYSPFNYNTRVMEWMNFPLKVSNLPKETRLGIDIHAVSRAGEVFLIGCCVKNIFDEIGCLRQGLVQMNIWPFYKVEKRLACMQEFYGVNPDEDFSEFAGFEQKNMKYSRIFVKFDTFISQNCVYSLKDENYYKNMYKGAQDPKKTAKISIKVKDMTIRGRKLYKEEAVGINKTMKPDAQDLEDLKLLRAKPQIDDLANLEQILLTDPLESLSQASKQVLIICREHYKSIPASLQLFLRAIDWTHPLQVIEAHKMLQKWSKMQFEDLLSLLNAEYADETIRLFCTQSISQISDEDMALYMPQLTQALCFECNHFSALSELLIERSLRNPQLVGHSLFWSLRSQLYLKVTAERFGLILEQFLMLCGAYRNMLLNEVHLMTFITHLGSQVATKESYTEKNEFLQHLISEHADMLPSIFTLPLDSSLECSGLIPEECKVMDSKKMPLWVSLKNKDETADPIPVIFKIGDDLRQDILTLQMIKVMDSIWLENGLDLKINTYRVVVTGDQSGLIEVVVKSETTSDIQKKYGGALGALRKNTLKDYLFENNLDKDSQEKALDTFIRSCAGYCVASFILGIADRHNGNIMITRTGHLFHIDFGHFLGNFKTKFGIQRERSNFVLTEEMAYVMGGKDSKDFLMFKEYCGKAYNLIRRHGRRIINFFKLMISAGMPELRNKEEIEYIRDMLSLKLTETEAVEKFNEEIDTALNNTFRRIDNLIHNLRRKGRN